MPHLICNWEGCTEVIGREYPATHWEPTEVDFYNEEHVDDDGYGYCDAHWEKYLQQQQDLKEQEEEDETEEEDE